MRGERPVNRDDARWPGIAGGLVGAAGVALSAYAAHGATADARRWLYTAAAMALVHGVLLVAYAARGPRLGLIARLAILAGLLLFSGSLVGAQLFGWPTPLAPTGGSLLILGWLLVAADRARR